MPRTPCVEGDCWAEVTTVVWIRIRAATVPRVLASRRVSNGRLLAVRPPWFPPPGGSVQHVHGLLAESAGSGSSAACLQVTEGSGRCRSARRHRGLTSRGRAERLTGGPPGDPGVSLSPNHWRRRCALHLDRERLAQDDGPAAGVPASATGRSWSERRLPPLARRPASRHVRPAPGPLGVYATRSRRLPHPAATGSSRRSGRQVAHRERPADDA